MLAQLAACTLAYAADELPQQHSDLMLRALVAGLAAAAVEMEAAVEAAAAAVAEAARQLPGAEQPSPLLAFGTLQCLLLAPDQPGRPSDVKVSCPGAEPDALLWSGSGSNLGSCGRRPWELVGL